MAERYSDFIWDYYGGRPFRSGCPGVPSHPGGWLKATAAEAGTGMFAGGDAGKEAGRDMEYFQTMYPEKMKRLQRSIGDLCDMIDYDGSILYDEYPDRVGLQRLCDEIFRKELPDGADERETEWLRAAIEVLLYHEVCRRRVMRRNSRRRFF